MERRIEVRHVSIQARADFDSFARAFERPLGRFDRSVLDETDPKVAERRLREMGGEVGVTLFEVWDHGAYLSRLRSPRKARQYVLGNPLIAITMTQQDIRAGLYAPLRMLVYEADDGSTRIEYDQPSSLFGQFDNPEITTMAERLDAVLTDLIQKTDLAAEQSRVLQR